MTPVDCRHEDDVLDALRTGRWPSGCDADLRTHVDACPSCRDLVEVAIALLEGREDAQVAATMPSVDVVWYRAQVRARQDAARVAARPIALAQGIGLGCALGLMVAGFGIGWPALSSWTAWFWGALPTITPPALAWPTTAFTFAEPSLPRLLLMGVGAFLLFVAAPATILFVWRQEP